WDIGLQALITGLTVDGVRYDPLIFFDNNQTGVTDGQNILASALVCVQDAQNVLVDRCFQLVDQNGIANPLPNGPVDLFDTSLNYGDPLTTNPVVANGTLCVSTTTKEVIAFNVASAAACPAGTVFINNNLGTNKTEFITTIPELNAQLEAFLALGYDLVSFQFLFQNQTNGFEDVFILLGAPRTTTQVPEPGTVLLLGLAALAGFGVTRYRRKP
ncbi:MAG: PEP-CTERM sorting domain-containing protein, partial [Pseudomonadota bacterium]